MEIEVKKPRWEWTVYFLFSIVVVGFGTAYLFSIPLCLLGRIFRPLWHLGGRILAFGVSTLMRVQPWFKADVRLNLPPVPAEGPGFLTISNHRSHLDMFILLSHIPNLRALTKKSLFKVPFLNVMMVVMKMIGVRRGDVESYFECMETAKQALRQGDPVHIFPEMTRCPEGFEGTQAFHLLPFRMAQEARVPLVPLVFMDTDRAWPKDSFGIRSGAQIKVRSLPPVDVTRFRDAAELRAHVQSQIDSALGRHEA